MIQIALPGETVGGDTVTCIGDDTYSHDPEVLHLQVCSSYAGYYVGFFCPQCGPYSRESGYYRTYEQAEKALKSGAFYR